MSIFDNDRQPPVTVAGRIEQPTKKAVLAHLYGRGEDLWLPRSQIEIEDDGDDVIIHIRAWLAEKNNIEND